MTFWDSERPLPPTDSYAEMAGYVSPALCYVREEIVDPGASLAFWEAFHKRVMPEDRGRRFAQFYYRPKEVNK